MEYREDLHDFAAPMAAEHQSLIARLNTPLTSSDNADAKLADLNADKAAYNSFVAELADRVERSALWGLPGIKSGFLIRSTRYKVLQHGPYRGIFLVDLPSNTAVGLVFSKAPHDLGTRIANLGERWSEQLNPGGKT